MERYGQFLGCNEKGAYVTLKTSPGLVDFLSRNGAASPSAANQIVTSTLSRFERFDGYFDYPANRYPVSVCYAPMHLVKKGEAYKGMKPLYAIAVNGAENKARDTSYACCAMMSREEILESKTFTYLDQIFGTPMISWMDMYEIRQNGKELDYSMKPRKVIPDLKKEDQEVVLSAVDAIYGGKNILIRLEKTHNFNNRAMELLQQIYSLLPPRLAVEVGFATYQNPKNIAYLTETAGLRIFLIPAEAELTAGGNMVAMDLTNPAAIKADTKSPVVKCARSWSRLSWEQRSEAMTKLFASREISFMDPDKFVEVTVAFFNDPFLSYKAEAGSVKDLDALKAKYDSFPLLSKNISWVNDRFRKMVPYLLPKGESLTNWKGEAISNAKTALTDEEKRRYTAQYKFAEQLECGDASIPALNKTEVVLTSRAKAAAEAEMKAVKEAAAAELAGAMAAAAAELERVKAEDAEQLRIKEESCAMRIAAANDELRKAKEEGETKLKAEQEAHAADNAKHTQVLQDFKVKVEQGINDMKAKFTAEIQQMTETHAAQLAAEQEKTSKAVATAAGLQTDLNTVKSDLATAKAAFADASAKANQLEANLIQKDTALQSARKEAADLKSTVDEANAQRDAANAKMAEQTKKLTELNEIVKAGRNMKELILSAVAGLAVGIIATVIVVLIVGAVTGGTEETIPTTIPTVPTTVPVETTLPPETTAPPETEPVETEPVVEEIDWDEVLYFSGMTDVETNEDVLSALLSEYDLTSGENILAIVTDAAEGFGTELPENFVVLIEKGENDEPSLPVATEPAATEPEETTEPVETTEPAETEEPAETTEPAETEPVILTLEEAADLILEGETYRLIVVGDADIRSAALKLFGLVNPQWDADVKLSVPMEDGTALELGQFLSQLLEAEDWWIGIEDASVQTTDLEEGKNQMSSSRTPVTAIIRGQDRIYVYDYTDDPAKAEEFQQIQAEKGRPVVLVDGILAVGLMAE